MEGPHSSYSSFDIHICGNVDREARMEPPIQAEYLRSGGATTLIFVAVGVRSVNSFCRRLDMPGNRVVPPASTTLLNRSLRMSTSHFMMELYTISWMPADSM